jgi:hypothetical protein
MCVSGGLAQKYYVEQMEACIHEGKVITQLLVEGEMQRDFP